MSRIARLVPSHAPLLDAVVAAVLTALAAFALVGVPSAMVGSFRPIPVLVGALALWLLLWVVWSVGPHEPVTWAPRATAVAVLVVIASTGLNARFSAQHLLTDRDPGVYMTTAEWLANRGTLLVDPDDGPYRGLEELVGFGASGYGEGLREDGRLYPQFVHLFPATLGASSWVIGTRGMLRLNALFGGLGLLAFFVFARRLVRPWAAVGATAALAASLVQVHFSRDAYTEVPTQLLLFGGLWMLTSAQATFHNGRALLAGLLVGSASMMRLDAFVFLIPLLVYAVFELARERLAASPREGVRAYAAAIVGGAAIPASVAWLDARLFSPFYLDALRSSLRALWVALAVVAVAAPFVLYVLPRVGPIRDGISRRKDLLAASSAVLIVALAAFAYFVRPHVEVAHQESPNAVVEMIQQREGLPIEGTRVYAEQSLVWLGWYLGPLALALGVIGIALITREVLSGRSQRLIPFLLAVLPMSLYYLWWPAITPDHLWAMRRFLPTTIPGLLLACFWLLDRWWDVRVPRLPARARRAGLAIGAVVAVAFPAWTLAPVVSHRTQLGMLSAVSDLCSHVSPGAVFILQGASYPAMLTQTVRSFCGVPAAWGPRDQPLEWYQDVARRWAEHDRALYLLSHSADLGPHLQDIAQDQVARVTFRDVEQTISRRPSAVEQPIFEIFVARIEAPAG